MMQPSHVLAVVLVVAAGASGTSLAAQVPTDTTPRHESSVHLTTGAAAGALSYPGGHAERAVSAVARLELRDWLAVSVSPSVSSVTEPSVTGGRVGASGLTDVPLGIEVGRTLPLPGAPSVGVEYSVTVPVGDTATGFGSGALGSSMSVSAGLSPAPKLSLYAGAGRSLSDFSLRSVLDGTAGTWGDASATVDVSPRLSLTAGVSGDLGAVDTTLGRTLAVSGGAGFHVGRMPMALNLSRGVHGAAPQWTVSVAVGSAFAYVGGIGHLRSPAAQIEETFGGGRHGLAPESKPAKAGKGSGGTGSGGSNGNNGVGHGNGRKKGP